MYIIVLIEHLQWNTCNFWDIFSKNGDAQSGLQKVGTAGTAGAGQITFGWTKRDSEEKNIGHIMTKAKKSHLFSQDYWTHSQITVG